MTAEKGEVNREGRPGRRGVPAERRWSERRSNHGRRHVERETGYAGEAVLTAHEACRYMCISRPTFIRLITAGKIRAQKVGRGWRILRTEIERFLRGE
jgi:excisionase family DNA binding protein